MSFTVLASWCGSWLVISGVLWTLFDKAEAATSSEAKQALTAWLMNVKPSEKLAHWSSTFGEAFDSVFGKRHFHWRCFLASTVASYLSAFIVTLLWGALRPHSLASIIEHRGIADFAFESFVFATILNVIPDYISLLESRFLIQVIARHPSVLRSLSLLALDLVITAAIGFSVVATALYNSGGDFDRIIRAGVKLETWGGDPSPSVFFYSTFFTSIWVWLYVLSGVCVKFWNSISYLTEMLKFILNIREKPFLSLGIVIILFITLVFLVVSPFVLLIHR